MSNRKNSVDTGSNRKKAVQQRYRNAYYRSKVNYARQRNQPLHFVSLAHVVHYYSIDQNCMKNATIFGDIISDSTDSFIFCFVKLRIKHETQEKTTTMVKSNQLPGKLLFFLFFVVVLFEGTPSIKDCMFNHSIVSTTSVHRAFIIQIC